MTKALQKQLCYAGGTLLGYLIARSSNAKETVPYTILGGVAGFAAGERLIGNSEGNAVKRNTTPPHRQAGASSLTGVSRRKKRKPTKK